MDSRSRRGVVLSVSLLLIPFISSYPQAGPAVSLTAPAKVADLSQHSAWPVVRTMVQVRETADHVSTENTSPHPFQAAANEILGSAGTYGDFARYLQNAPGVLGNGDWSNDLIVRGGNPMENLFLVDGIEVPNISQISVEGTTGGLSTMIDTAAIQSVDLYTGGYDATYAERLSAVVDIHPREMIDRQSYAEGEIGYIGAGGLEMLPLGRNGSLLVSGHRSFLNLISSNIGLGGTPVYSNMLLRGQLRLSGEDDLTFLSLSGGDTLNMTPGGPGHDSMGTNEINMQYSGWRSTNGLRWRHMYGPRALGILTVSDSEQEEQIAQQNQFLDILKTTSKAAQSIQPVPVYSQFSHDGRSYLKYDVLFDSAKKWALLAGTGGYLNRVNDRVAQPVGEHSSLSTNPAALDANSFAPDFTSGETATYAEVTWRPWTWWSLSGGGRLQSFALGGHWTATPRLNTALRISPHTGVHAAYGEYAQMPPTIDMVSWQQNRALVPIRVRHIIAGADLYTGGHARIGIEAYQKDYRRYPVSTEYPSLSLANMADDLGTQILWLPLTSQGTGQARGVELSASAHLGQHLSAQLSVSYSHTRYAGLDGVMRPGNFDFPLTGATTGSWRSGKRYEVS
jgi:hypothetical protein